MRRLTRKTDETVTLLDPDLVWSRFGKDIKEQKKAKKSTPAKSTYQKDIKELDAKWSECLS